MSAIARTTTGTIEGTEEDGLCVFRGVPFAAPPVGALRFRAPQPVEPWEGVREAKSFGPIALQAANPMLEALLPPPDPVQPQSEDCLYLNLWTPGVDGGSRPVMVWIHGGAFTIGSGSENYYDGSNLVSRGDVVVVTINYRLGAFGFLNLPSLGETNFGMRDQVAALRWVQENIASFGGDPGNVTIFGESAGGMSVGSQMASPEAAGLFHKAIPQSGACHNALTLEETEATGRRFCEKLGVEPDDVEALRAASAADVLAASVAVDPLAAADFDGDAASALPEMPFQPVIDGSFLEKLPIEHVREGSAAGVATLVGSLDEEMKLMSAMGAQEAPTEEGGDRVAGDDASRRRERIRDVSGGAPRARRGRFAGRDHDRGDRRRDAARPGAAAGRRADIAGADVCLPVRLEVATPGWGAGIVSRARAAVCVWHARVRAGVRGQRSGRGCAGGGHDGHLAGVRAHRESRRRVGGGAGVERGDEADPGAGRERARRAGLARRRDRRLGRRDLVTRA